MKILNVTPEEYFRLMDARAASIDGYLQADVVARVLGISEAELRWESFRLVVRRDCTFIPVYWRGVMRIES